MRRSLLLLLLAVPAGADPVGRAEFVTVQGGPVEVLRDGVARAAVVGARIGEGESVRTGAGGTAILRLAPGGSRVVVGPGTVVSFTRLRHRAIEMDVPRGALWTRAVMPSDAAMRVTSPNATAGVRGTRFSVLTSDSSTHVCNCEGIVSVESPRGRATLTTGKFAEVHAGRSAPPVPQDERRILRRPPADGTFDFCFTCHVRGGGGELRRDSYFDF